MLSAALSKLDRSLTMLADGGSIAISFPIVQRLFVELARYKTGTVIVDDGETICIQISGSRLSVTCDGSSGALNGTVLMNPFGGDIWQQHGLISSLTNLNQLIMFVRRCDSLQESMDWLSMKNNWFEKDSSSPGKWHLVTQLVKDD